MDEIRIAWSAGAGPWKPDTPEGRQQMESTVARMNRPVGAMLALRAREGGGARVESATHGPGSHWIETRQAPVASAAHGIADALRAMGVARRGAAGRRWRVRGAAR